MNERKTETKRLVIFLIFAFGLTWIPAIILNRTLGYKTWFETGKVPAFTYFFGYGPALANVITRKITHEGWHDSMLELKLKENIRYYLFSFLAIPVISLPIGAMTTIICGKGDWSGLGEGYTVQEAVSTVLIIFASAPLMSFNTFGEEFGWRAYMNQKLEYLFGTTGTVIIGGIIWGLWHAELTVEGHNFGTDYKGYPWLGITAMCIFCTFMGMILMWLTKKTGTIYPACILHAMNNNGGKILSEFLISGVDENYELPLTENIMIYIPIYIAGLICLVLTVKENKKLKAVRLYEN